MRHCWYPLIHYLLNCFLYNDNIRKCQRGRLSFVLNVNNLSPEKNKISISWAGVPFNTMASSSSSVRPARAENDYIAFSTIYKLFARSLLIWLYWCSIYDIHQYITISWHFQEYKKNSRERERERERERSSCVHKQSESEDYYTHHPHRQTDWGANQSWQYINNLLILYTVTTDHVVPSTSCIHILICVRLCLTSKICLELDAGTRSLFLASPSF